VSQARSSRDSFVRLTNGSLPRLFAANPVPVPTGTDRSRGRLLKPPPFTYVAPSSLDEALSSLAEAGEDAKILAGGQSLMPLLSLRLARPSALVDLRRVDGLGEISEHDGTVTIGTMVRERAVERSDVIAEKIPLLAAALPLIGHPAIRNRGTVGGSIAHADPSAEIPAVALALDAEMVIRSAARGERRVPAADFFQGFFTTALEPDEALVAVCFPVAAPVRGVAFVEAARRHGDFAMVGAAAVVNAEGGRITDARITLIGVADTPLRRPAAEQALSGAEIGSLPFEDAAAAAAAGLTPASDIHGTSQYRTHLARVLTRRALEKAASELRGAA
jgi:aerobic carbon-monoxide dehydrogenase medium subunit